MDAIQTRRFTCAVINEMDLFRGVFPCRVRTEDCAEEGFELVYYNNEQTIPMTNEQMLDLLRIQHEEKSRELDRFTAEQKEVNAQAWVVNNLEMLDRCIELVEGLENG